MHALSSFRMICLAGLLLAPGLRAASPGDEPALFDWGFWASRRVDPDGNLRFKAAGPFIERSTSLNGDTFTAVRPFYTRLSDGENELREIFWPLYADKTVQNQSTWRAGFFMGVDYNASEPGSQYRNWFLPFYFEGRDHDGRTYRAVMPFYGSLHDFLGRDQIKWTLFPLYTYSRIKDVEAHSVLWPLYSRTRGPGVERFRIFPLYGYSKREGRFDRYFVLWPLWNAGSWPNGSGFMLFPIYGHFTAGNTEMTYWFPPFFKTVRGGKNETTHALWPLYQQREGETSKWYLWPLIGTKTIGTAKRSFFLWPVFWKVEALRPDETVTRHFAVPLWQHETRRIPEGKPGAGETMARSFKLWPVFSYRREGDRVRRQALDLWPLNRPGPINRNYGPFWSMYTYYSNGTYADTEILWGLYRKSSGEGLSASTVFPLYDRESSPDTHSWQILKGLLGRKKDDSGTSWRIFYVPLKGKAYAPD